MCVCVGACQTLGPCHANLAMSYSAYGAGGDPVFGRGKVCFVYVNKPFLERPLLRPVNVRRRTGSVFEVRCVFYTAGKGPVGQRR